MTLLLAAAMVLAPLPMGSLTAAAATEIQAGLPAFNVNTAQATTVGFGGKQWVVIGGDGKGVAHAPNALTLLLADGQGNPYGKTVFHGSSKVYSASTLKTKMDDAYAALPENEKGLVTERKLTGGNKRSDTYRVKKPELTGGSGNSGSGTYNDNSIAGDDDFWELRYPGDNDNIAGADVTGAKFWPLSINEANAVNNDLRFFDEIWWLRLPGDDDYLAAIVFECGDVFAWGNHVSIAYAVRPAFYLPQIILVCCLHSTSNFL